MSVAPQHTQSYRTAVPCGVLCADLIPGEHMQLVMISGTIEQVKSAYMEVRQITLSAGLTMNCVWHFKVGVT